jgi:hypothetical protein
MGGLSLVKGARIAMTVVRKTVAKGNEEMRGDGKEEVDTPLCSVLR